MSPLDICHFYRDWRAKN